MEFILVLKQKFIYIVVQYIILHESYGKVKQFYFKF
jgi:hypothetical protein